MPEVRGHQREERDREKDAHEGQGAPQGQARAEGGAVTAFRVLALVVFVQGGAVSGGRVFLDMVRGGRTVDRGGVGDRVVLGRGGRPRDHRDEGQRGHGRRGDRNPKGCSVIQCPLPA